MASSLFSKIAQFATSPQGKKAISQAKDFASKPENKAKIEQAAQKLRGKGRGTSGPTAP